MKRIALLAAAIALFGCQTLNVINPTYSLRGVNPRINFGIPPSIDLDFTVGVDNPNPVELRLDRLDFDVLINNQLVLNNVRSDQGIHIPSRGLGDVHLLAHLNFSNLQTIYNQILELVQGNRASYQLRGNAYYNTPVGQLRFPVTVGR